MSDTEAEATAYTYEQWMDECPHSRWHDGHCLICAADYIEIVKRLQTRLDSALALTDEWEKWYIGPDHPYGAAVRSCAKGLRAALAPQGTPPKHEHSALCVGLVDNEEHTQGTPERCDGSGILIAGDDASQMPPKRCKGCPECPQGTK